MTPKRRVFTTDERKALLERYEASNRTVAEFCRDEGISIATLYQWRTGLQGRQSKRRVKDERFIELTQVPCPITPHYEQQPVWSIEIATKSGITVRVRE